MSTKHSSGKVVSSKSRSSVTSAGPSRRSPLVQKLPPGIPALKGRPLLLRGDARPVGGKWIDKAVYCPYAFYEKEQRYILCWKWHGLAHYSGCRSCMESGAATPETKVVPKVEVPGVPAQERCENFGSQLLYNAKSAPCTAKVGVGCPQTQQCVMSKALRVIDTTVGKGNYDRGSEDRG